MAAYIDVDKLIDKINSRIKNTLIRGWLASIINETISEQPTADVEEVKHGEWIVNAQCNHKPYRYKNPEKWVTYKCSECGYSNGRRKPNYCSNCGAKMDGGKTE